MKKFTLLFVLLLFSLKHDAQNFKWAKSYGNIAFSKGTSIDVDKFGNVYTAGLFYGTVSFGQGYTLTPNMPSSYAAFVLKQDSLGNVLWVKQLGYGASSFSYNIYLKVDSIGSVYTMGGYSGTGDFDPGVGTYTLQNNSYLNMFVLKLDAFGNFLWAKQIQNLNNNFQKNALALDVSKKFVFDWSIYRNGRF
jgi:hypothetical protein